MRSMKTRDQCREELSHKQWEVNSEKRVVNPNWTRCRLSSSSQLPCFVFTWQNLQRRHPDKAEKITQNRTPPSPPPPPYKIKKKERKQQNKNPWDPGNRGSRWGGRHRHSPDDGCAANLESVSPSKHIRSDRLLNAIGFVGNCTVRPSENVGRMSNRCKEN